MKKQKKIKQFNLSKYLVKHKCGVFFYILTTILGSVISIFFTLCTAAALEKFTNKEFTLAIYTFLFTLMLSIVRRIMWTLSNYIYNKYSLQMVSEINVDLAKQAFKLNSETYTNHEVGTFVQRIIGDPDRVVNGLAGIIDMISDIISSVVIFIYITTLNFYIGLIIIALILICFINEYFRLKFYKKNRKRNRKSYDKINSLTTEIVRSEKDVKSIGLEDKLSEVSKINYDNYKKSSYKTNMIDMAFWASRNFLIESVSILMLVFGVVLVNKALLTVAAFMIVYSNSGGLYGLVWQLGNISTQITDIKISLDRMSALFDNEEFVCENFGIKNLDHIIGKIEFKNVSYAYKEYEKELTEEEKEEANKNKTKDEIKRDKKREKANINKKREIIATNKIFEDLNFSIEPNTTVAFVGKSGSGKSTILSLMSKMYEVDGGEVLIDGVNINELNKETLRKAISLVNQFPYIFDMTIKDNLLLAKKDATDEELNQAIKDASFDDFVITLRKGIDTQVGESGIKLSGGQKQRLSIARALLRNSNIIIFDESTSSLDNFAQGNIKKSIDNLKGKSTVVIVAHRLSTIKDVDKIFFLDEGKIIDSGTFDYLFEHNEKFKTMFLAENI